MCFRIKHKFGMICIFFVFGGPPLKLFLCYTRYRVQVLSTSYFYTKHINMMHYVFKNFYVRIENRESYLENERFPLFRRGQEKLRQNRKIMFSDFYVDFMYLHTRY